MGIEKRKSRRTDVNVYISLRQLDDKYVSGYAGDTVDVNVINISKDGMAFKSDYKFKPNTYYDTVVILANKERLATVIELYEWVIQGMQRQHTAVDLLVLVKKISLR